MPPVILIPAGVALPDDVPDESMDVAGYPIRPAPGAEEALKFPLERLAHAMWGCGQVAEGKLDDRGEGCAGGPTLRWRSGRPRGSLVTGWDVELGSDLLLRVDAASGHVRLRLADGFADPRLRQPEKRLLE